MICVEQTKHGGLNVPPSERGDCMSACIASVLEIPLVDVPHFAAMYDDSVPASEDYAWWDALERFAAARALDIWWLDHEGIRDYTPTGFWLASVSSLNIRRDEGQPARHVIVMKGREIAWDPNVAPSKRYEGTALPEGALWGGYVFVPHDPAAVAPR